MKEIVIATKNNHKIIEFTDRLSKLGYQVKSLFDFEEFPDIIEDKDTFKGNALKKAQELSEYLQKDVIADDSGLEVEALDNAPGVYSARYAGEHVSYEDNNQKLLQDLQGVTNRKARFVTTICLYQRGHAPQFFIGYLQGEIAHKYQGTNGFGYDPIFIVNGDMRHLAEYSLDEKNKISHRAKAMDQLLDYLEK